MSPLKIIREKDGSEIRGRFFSYFVKTNIFYRLIYKLYQIAPLKIKAMLLLGYGIFRAIQIESVRCSGKILAVYWSPNEKRQIDFFEKVVGMNDFVSASMHKFNFRIFLKLIERSFVRSTMKRAIVHAHLEPFLVAARLVEFLCCREAFIFIYSRSRPTAVFVFSDVNPYALAAVWAGRHFNIKTIYSNHSHVSEANTPLVCDVNFLLSAAIGDLYSHQKKYIIRGWDYESEPFKEIKFNILKVGIFFSVNPDFDKIEDMIRVISYQFPKISFVIRPHPVRKSLTFFKVFKLMKKFKNVHFDMTGRHLKDFSKNLDFALIGNSSAHIDCLKLGIRTVYYSELDTSPYDYQRFVENGLVVPISDPLQFDPNTVVGFYSNPLWSRVMSYYDAGYFLNDSKRCVQEIRNAFENLNTYKG